MPLQIGASDGTSNITFLEEPNGAYDGALLGETAETGLGADRGSELGAAL